MIDKIETWKAPKEVVVAIIDLALEHIKKVELNPKVETEGDNFDYWNSYDLGDGNYVDYNIHCGDDLGEINILEESFLSCKKPEQKLTLAELYLKKTNVYCKEKRSNYE